MKTIKLIVSGKVQGVNYRAFILRNATELGIEGTVRNLPSGEVEIIATGPESHLEKLENIAARGPMMASVRGVEREEMKLQQFDDFKILRNQ